jgi:uncharacterized protein involved in exopolysaccharide biosynthesis/Mrp family chromosome partitioning ATPase/nicotinamidase-related amidase
MAHIPDTSPHRPLGLIPAVYPAPRSLRATYAADALRYASEGDAGEESLDFVGLARRLWRKKFFILATTVLATSAIGLYLANTPSHYVAHVMLLVGNGDANAALGTTTTNVGMPVSAPDPAMVESHIEMLKSPALASEVVRDLQLYNTTEFNPTLAKRTGWGAWIEEHWNNLFGSETKPASEGEVPTGLEETVANFMSRLNANVRGTSRVIDLSFDSVDPTRAAAVANAVAKQYIAYQRGISSQSAEQMARWLHDKVAQLTREVQTSEAAIEKFRAASGLYASANGPSLAVKQMDDLSAQLITAQADRATLEARLHEAHLQAGSSNDVGDTGSNPGLIQALKTQESTLEGQLAQATMTLGSKHPKILELDSQIAQIKGRIRAETANSLRDLAARVKVASTREQNLRDRLNEAKQAVDNANAAEVTLRALQRTAEANKIVLTNFIARYNQESLESDRASQRPEVHIVSAAERPIGPDRPKRGLLTLIAAACSFLAGSILALARENLQQGFYSVEDLEAATHIQPLGLVPLAAMARVSPVWSVSHRSPYREAIRAVYANLFLLGRRKTKVTVVTSSFPGEGKTTLAIGLAAMAGISGHRAILLDFDFWRAGASTALGFQPMAGLAEVLENKIDVSSVIVTDQTSGIDVITPGRLSLMAGSTSIEKVDGLLRTLANRGYEFVIIDAPPIFAVPDALVLAAHADITVMAVRWASTARSSVKLSLKRLREARAVVSGFVMTMVDGRRHAEYGTAYGYGESAYFSKDLADYHTQTAPALPSVNSSRRSQDYRKGLRGIRNRIAGRIVSAATAEFFSPQRAKFLSRREKATPVKPWRYKHPRQALIVVDVQREYTSSSGLYALSQPAVDNMIEAINRVVQVAHMSDILVIFVQQEFQTTRARLLANLALGRARIDATAAQHIDSRIKFTPNRLFSKRFADAFSNLALDDFLRSEQITQIFIAGLDGALAINQTARGGLARGYRVNFISDGIETVFEKKWQRFLRQYEEEAVFAITSWEFSDLFRNRMPCSDAMVQASI